jgi:hypothetical protein
MVLKKAHAVAVLLATLLVSGAAAQETGSISGTVLLDKQTALGNSKVVYNRIVKVARDSKGSIVELESTVSGVVVTGPDGSFAVKSLPVGAYYLCALPVEANQIRSCDAASTTVGVKAAAAASSATLNVTTGVLVSIVFADPKAKITSKMLTVGWMAANGSYYRATLAATTALGSTFTVAVPKNSQGNLFLDSPLSIVDATGSAVPLGARSVPVSPAADSAITINLTVQ